MSYPAAPQHQPCWHIGGPLDMPAPQECALATSRPGRRARWLGVTATVLLIAVAATAGFVATNRRVHDAVSVPRTATTVALQKWWAKTQDDFANTQHASREVDKVFTQFRPYALAAACHYLHDSAEIELQSDLPSPNPRVTAELHAAIEDFHAASHMCLAVFAGSKVNYDGEFFSSVAEGDRHMQAAQKIINRVLSDV